MRRAARRRHQNAYLSPTEHDQRQVVHRAAVELRRLHDGVQAARPTNQVLLYARVTTVANSDPNCTTPAARAPAT